MAQAEIKAIPRPGRCQRAAEILKELCLAPALDYPAGDKAQELRRDIWKLRRELDEALSPEVRAKLLHFIQDLDKNRHTYISMLLSWLDLIEELTLSAEKEYGDGAGPLKLKYVDDAMEYVLIQQTKDLHVDIPWVPALLEPLARRLMIRTTVEFIITLVNNERIPDIGLWKNQALPGRKSWLPFTRQGRIRDFRYRIGQWLVRWLFKPPQIPEDVKARLDVILEDLQNEGFSLENSIRQFFEFLQFAGQNAKEIRHLIQALSVAIKISADFTEGSREERLEWVREAMVLYLEDLGFSGPYFRVVSRMVLNIVLEPMVHLYERREVLSLA